MISCDCGLTTPRTELRVRRGLGGPRSGRPRTEWCYWPASRRGSRCVGPQPGFRVWVIVCPIRAEVWARSPLTGYRSRRYRASSTTRVVCGWIAAGGSPPSMMVKSTDAAGSYGKSKKVWAAWLRDTMCRLVLSGLLRWWFQRCMGCGISWLVRSGGLFGDLAEEQVLACQRAEPALT